MCHQITKDKLYHCDRQKNRYVSHLRVTTDNSTFVVGISTKDEVYSSSDITAKPYYLKRNYQDLQMLTTLV